MTNYGLGEPSPMLMLVSHLHKPTFALVTDSVKKMINEAMQDQATYL
jgi:hypothetical protein